MSEITRTVAQGIQQRHSEQAFVAVPLPGELLDCPTLVGAVFGNSEQTIYDRYTEGKGFVFLSHIWLLADRA